MDKELTATSEIGKMSVYESPTAMEEQIVVDRTFETVLALSGDVVVTRDKEAFLSKISPANKVYYVPSPADKTDAGKSIINKTATVITRTDKTNIVKSLVSQTYISNSRMRNTIQTDSMLETRYEAGSIISQTFIVNSKIKKEVIGEALY